MRSFADSQLTSPLHHKELLAIPVWTQLPFLSIHFHQSPSPSHHPSISSYALHLDSVAVAIQKGTCVGF